MTEVGDFVDVVVRGDAGELAAFVDSTMRWADWQVHWLDPFHGWARSKYAGSLNHSRWVQLDMVVWSRVPGEAAVRLTCSRKSSVFTVVNLLEKTYEDLPGLVRLLADTAARQGRLVGVFPGRLPPSPPPAAAPPPPPLVGP